MDHKSWLWKKRSTEKIIISDDNINISKSRNEDETLIDYKAQLERDLKILNEKLSSALSECNHKDDFAKKQAKIAQEAISGWEKTETEALSLKQELNKALQQLAISEERLVHLDAALKECMQQSHSVQEEQEKRIHVAVMKTSKECESARISLDQELAEAKRRISRLERENTQLSKALLAKEKVIDELNNHRAQTEADLSSLINRLEYTEKENASLKYDVRVLEKELEIRNEEIEFNRRTADVAHKQYMESVKKIAKLESECQRLRILVCKRLPGPAALAKMKNEVDLLRRDQAGMRRRDYNPSPLGSIDFSADVVPDTLMRKIKLLTEQLCLIEVENRSLKEALNKGMNEIQSSVAMRTQTSSSISQLRQLGGHVTADPHKNIYPTLEASLRSMSDMGSDDKASCAESWASALISELEQFKNGKLAHTPSSRTVGASDISLMDDFVEMEKLAVVSGDILCADNRESKNHADAVCAQKSLCQVSLHDSLYADSSEKATGDDTYISTKSIPKQQSNLNKSIHKIVELIEGIGMPPMDDCNAQMSSRKHDRLLQYTSSDNPVGYVGRMFQWKASELSSTLKQFVQTCNDLLNGKSDLESFTEKLACTLEWIMNHCFSLQDVSSMKDAIRNYLDWDGSRSESEVDSGTTNPISESNKLTLQGEEQSSLPLISLSNGHKSDFEVQAVSPTVKEERHQSEVPESVSLTVQHQESHNTNYLKIELKTLKQMMDKKEHQNEKYKKINEDLEAQLIEAKNELKEACEKLMHLESEPDNHEHSSQQLDVTCHDMHLPLESISEKGTPDGMANNKRELRTDWEIVAASEKLAECQDTILNLGKQLKALASPREAALFDKVIPSPARDMVVSTMRTPEKNIRQRSSLLDKMLDEDKTKINDLSCHRTEEAILLGNSHSAFALNGTMEHQEFASANGAARPEDGAARPEDGAVVASMAIVPGKKKGSGGLLKKLLRRAKKGRC